MKYIKLRIYICTYRHLHLELRKISHEMNSVFGIQMTIKMICYFGWIILDLRRILCEIFINSYIISKIILIFVNLIWFCHNVFKFVLINYVCETVTTKVFFIYFLKINLKF